MRNWIAGLCIFSCACAAGDDLLLLSALPLELFKSRESAYQPVAMVQQVLKYYPAPYTIEAVNLNRAFAELQSRTGSCVVGVRKTPQRMQDFLFSQPYIIAPDIRLLVKADSVWARRLQRLQDPTGLLSLQQILSLKSPPVLVTEEGRAYGHAIDALLSEHKRHHAMYLKTTKVSRFGETLPMLSKGFVDVALEYPVVVPPEAGGTLQSFRLKEADPFALAYFACKRDAATAEFLQQLNNAILAFRNKPEFRTMLVEPFPQEERVQVWQQWLKLTSEE